MAIQPLPNDSTVEQPNTGVEMPVWLPYAAILVAAALALYLIERGQK